MIELERFAKEQLKNLPKNHPDRKAIEGIAAIAESLNAARDGRADTVPVKEPQVEAKRFTPEAREALEKEGYRIYTLTGQSIRSLREAGRKFWSTWHKDYPEFENKTSMLSEVAINPNQLFLPNSNNKTLSQQEKIVEKFSKEIAKKVNGVKAIIGEAQDYEELAFTHLDKTGEYLFGDKYNYDYARTKTPTVDSNVAHVGRFYAVRGLSVYHWRAGRGRSYVWAAPLVVPA